MRSARKLPNIDELHVFGQGKTNFGLESRLDATRGYPWETWLDTPAGDA